MASTLIDIADDLYEASADQSLPRLVRFALDRMGWAVDRLAAFARK